MDERSFGLFKPSELKVDVLPFDSLKRFGESQYGNSESASRRWKAKTRRRRRS
ncbi:hypothetical protein G3435_17115 [Pseudomonas sp. MAFF212428]|uniref:Uncharacterized protein n=1 Tax=Pseudomonas brassicae TaxID=2708063 RepID=A0A6M0CUV5_9PSED|nr:hypothetical protein [Pseudomonas brassicae]